MTTPEIDPVPASERGDKHRRSLDVWTLRRTSGLKRYGTYFEVLAEGRPIVRAQLKANLYTNEIYWEINSTGIGSVGKVTGFER